MGIKKQRFKNCYSELKKFSTENDFWLQLVVGGLIYNKAKKCLERELFFLKLENGEYRSLIHYENTIKKILVVEQKTRLFSVGSIFNCEGKFVKKPDCVEKYIDEKKTILSNSFNKSIPPIANLFKRINLLSGESDSFNNVFYFSFKSNYNSVEVVIPSSLIGRYFHYHSSDLIKFIVDNEFHMSIKQDENNPSLIIYDSTKISKEDATLLGKYFFTSNYSYPEYKCGIDMLKKSIDELYVQLMNFAKRMTFDVTDINFSIPFNFPLDVYVVGQFLTDDIFLAYDITGVDPFGKVKGKPFFSTKNFTLMDINAANPSGSGGGKDDNSKKSPKGKDDRDDSDETDVTEDAPLDKSLSTVQLPMGAGGVFNITPKPRVVENMDQFNKEVARGVILVPHDGFGFFEDEDSTDPDGKRKRHANASFLAEYCHAEVIKKVLGQLNELDDFDVDFLTINQSDDDTFSQVLLPSDDSGTKLIPLTTLIASVIYKGGRQVVIIDAGTGLKIGMFENMGIPFVRRNDVNLTSFVNFMLKEYRFQWSEVFFNERVKEENLLKKTRYDNIKKSYRINVLQPMKHIDKDDVEELLKNLKGRIVARVVEN